MSAPLLLAGQDAGDDGRQDAVELFRGVDDPVAVDETQHQPVDEGQRHVGEIVDDVGIQIGAVRQQLDQDVVVQLGESVDRALQGRGDHRVPGGLNGQLVARLGAAQLRVFAGLDDDLGQRGGRPLLDRRGVGDGLQRRQVEFDHPLGDRVQQRRAGAEVERGRAVGDAGAAVDLQMTQAFGAVVGQQLYRRVAQFAAALIGIGLASLRYPGSVAAAHPRFRCKADPGD